MLITKENTAFLDGTPSDWGSYKEKFVVIAKEDTVYWVDKNGNSNGVMYSQVDYSTTPPVKLFSPHENVRTFLLVQEENQDLKEINARLTTRIGKQQEKIEELERKVAPEMKDFVDTARLVELSKAGYKSDDLVKLRSAGIV